jgi:hypothetical protein
MKNQIKKVERETNAKKDLNGCNNEVEEVVQLESKWVPLKVPDSVVVALVAVPELTVVLGGYLSHPFFFTQKSSTFFLTNFSNKKFSLGLYVYIEQKSLNESMKKIVILKRLINIVAKSCY